MKKVKREEKKTMIIFNSDLDNTIIFSYKHDIGDEKINVEIYQEREISFITKKTHELLKQVAKEVVFVPTTTRTIEQYQRIDLKIGMPHYALVCNGGVLLVDGKEDESWYKESLKNIENAKEQMHKAIEILNEDIRRTFEVRFIKDLFVFTKCECPENVIKDLGEILDTKVVDVFNNGTKVYVVPKNLSKGVAIERFKKYINADFAAAAGDSEFDISMFEKADVSIAPKELSEKFALPENTVIMPGKSVFSEEVLKYILKLTK